jgi:hypothetical protein
MNDNATSVITLLISGISASWAAIIGLVLYVRSLHIRAEKKAEIQSRMHLEDVKKHKDEILDVTKKFAEVVTNVNNSIVAVDRTIESRNKSLEATIDRNIRAFDDLHKAVVQGMKLK